MEPEPGHKKAEADIYSKYPIYIIGNEFEAYPREKKPTDYARIGFSSI